MTRRGGRRGLVDVTMEGDEVVVTTRGWWAFLSLRRRIRLPREAVRSAHVSGDPTAEVPVTWRSGGTGTFMIRAGYWRGSGVRSWWCYRYGQPAVLIELTLTRLQAVVVMTDDDDATVDAIMSARQTA